MTGRADNVCIYNYTAGIRIHQNVATSISTHGNAIGDSSIIQGDVTRNHYEDDIAIVTRHEVALRGIQNLERCGIAVVF